MNISTTIGIDGILPPAGHALHVWHNPPAGVNWYDDTHSISTTLKYPNGSTKSLPGPAVAFLTANPGAYVITRVIDGETQTFSISLTSNRKMVFVDPVKGNDANVGTTVAPRKTLPPLVSHMEVWISTGDIRLANAIDLGPIQDFVIGMWNVGTGTKTRVLARGTIFNLSKASRDITIKNLHLDSDDPSGQPVASEGSDRGINITKSGLTLGNLTVGDVTQVDDAARGILLQNIDEESATSVKGQSIMELDVDQFVAVDSDYKGSGAESPARTTGKGIRRALLFNTTIDQPPTNGKADITLRAGDQIWVESVTCSDADLSIRTGGAEEGTTPSQTTNVLIRKSKIVRGKLDIGPGAAHIRISDVEVDCLQTGGECVSFEQGPPFVVTDVKAKRLTLRGFHSGVKTKGAFKIPNDLQVDDSVYIGPGPFAKDYGQNPMTVGTGNTRRDK